MTQEQFAIVLGASVDTLRKWEQGARQQGAETGGVAISGATHDTK